MPTGGRTESNHIFITVLTHLAPFYISLAQLTDAGGTSAYRQRHLSPRWTPDYHNKGHGTKTPSSKRNSGDCNVLAPSCHHDDLLRATHVCPTEACQTFWTMGRLGCWFGLVFLHGLPRCCGGGNVLRGRPTYRTRTPLKDTNCA